MRVEWLDDPRDTPFTHAREQWHSKWLHNERRFNPMESFSFNTLGFVVDDVVVLKVLFIIALNHYYPAHTVVTAENAVFKQWSHSQHLVCGGPF